MMTEANKSFIVAAYVHGAIEAYRDATMPVSGATLAVIAERALSHANTFGVVCDTPTMYRLAYNAGAYYVTNELFAMKGGK